MLIQFYKFLRIGLILVWSLGKHLKRNFKFFQPFCMKVLLYRPFAILTSFLFSPPSSTKRFGFSSSPPINLLSLFKFHRTFYKWAFFTCHRRARRCISSYTHIFRVSTHIFVIAQKFFFFKNISCSKRHLVMNILSHTYVFVVVKQMTKIIHEIRAILHESHKKGC